MHKLIEYICDELEELEHKADKDKLTMAELQYVDLLAHAKKNLLTADAMMDAEDHEYSNDYSYARGRGTYAKRDSMGRYSRDMAPYRMKDGGMMYRGYSRADAKEEMIKELHEMERDADEETKQMIRKWIRQAEEH